MKVKIILPAALFFVLICIGLPVEATIEIMFPPEDVAVRVII